MTPEDSGRRWGITAAVMLVATMQILDTSVTNVALPHMQGSLSASLDEITWVLTSFIAANAVILPATGWLVARLGRRRFFLLSTITFLVSSLLSGAAPNLELLVAARLLQGLGGGPLIPLAQAILLEIFPPRQRGMAMAIWGLGIMVSPIVGPTVGGWITENYSWRWIFYLNLPFGALALALGSVFLEDPAPERTAGRGPAMARSTASASRSSWRASGRSRSRWTRASAWTGSTRPQSRPWPSWRFSGPPRSSAGSCASPIPLVDLRVLANRTFALGTLLITVVGFGLYSSFLLLTFYAQHLLRYDALTAGLGARAGRRSDHSSRWRSAAAWPIASTRAGSSRSEWGSSRTRSTSWDR